MLFAGLQRHRGRVLRFWPSTVVGSLANLVGSWIAYAAGYYGRVELVERHGNKLHIKQSHLDWADRWFERYGDAAVFFSRMLPIIRTFISLPAGVARMPFWRFTRPHLLGLPAVDVHARASSASRRATTGTSGRTSCTTSTTRSPPRSCSASSTPRPLAAEPRTSARPMPRRRASRVTAAGCRSATRWRSALLHGPAELLPISSSGHIDARALAAGWPYAELDPELRKAFEVALHAGTAAALLIALRGEVREAAHRPGPRGGCGSPCSRSCRRPSPAAAFERAIERRLGTPGDRRGRPARSARRRWWRADRRARSDAPRGGRAPSTRWRSALAQACALVPGRLAQRADARRAARARLPARGRERALAPRRAAGHRRRQRRSRARGWRSAGCPPARRAPSPRAPARRSPRRSGPPGSSARSSASAPCSPYAAYRAGLAALVIRRLRQNRRR